SPDLVWNENQHPGDSGWHADFDAGDPAFGLYARPQSLFAGDRLDVHVSATAHADAKWQVYRLGHYHGAGGRKLAEGTTTIDRQPDPTLDPSTGLVECRWASSFSVPLGADWPSGVYLVRVELADGSARFAPFIVRDRRPVDVLVILPTNTDQAYNTWGGESLYFDSRYQFPVGHAYEVSFDRPFDLTEQGGYFLYSAMPAVEYLEANGYDVAYAADRDVHADSSLLLRARLVMVLAHDEYWSRQMRDHYEAARAAGVSLAFLGANIGFWQVRFAPGADGTPDRRMIGYKEAASLDPLWGSDDADVTDAFRSATLKRPENALLGVMSGDWHFADFPWRVADAGHWLYAGLGVHDGDRIPDLVGLESDFTQANGAAPAGLSIVAQSPTVSGDYETTNDLAQATVYEPTPTSFVFAAASIRLPSLLSGPRAQLEAQRMVRNLIAHAGGTPVAPEDTLGAHDGWAAADLSQAPPSLDVIAGAVGDCRAVDGAGTTARFAAPTGLALLGDGTLVVADAAAHQLRRVAASADRTVAPFSGSGASGDADGAATAAGFHAPWAVAAAPDGSVWVADRIGGSVRHVAADGGVTTVLARPTVTAPGGIAVAADGTVYVVDGQIGGLTVVHPGGAVDRPALAAGTFLTGAFADGGDLYVADSGRCQLDKRAADGTLTTLAGAPGFADGGIATARLCPLGAIARRDNVLLVGDGGNDTVRIVDSAAGTVRSLAAPGGALVHPLGVAVDAARRIVYVADTGNCVIRAASY
ncbi:MAG TPA: N,N-dimethylformamidase beta subunit family domain-containing protein, partial [Polyangia bacterium]